MVPGVLVTIAFRDLVIRLKRVDLPTFGRPASTTDGRPLLRLVAMVSVDVIENS